MVRIWFLFSYISVYQWFPPLPPKKALYDMHASDDTGHHDAGYSYDTGHQNVYPSHRQLTRAAIFIFKHDKDLSSGCTLPAETKIKIYFPSLYPVLKICDQCYEQMDTFPVASFLSLL